MIGGCWNVLLRLNEGRIMIIIRGNDAGLELYSAVRLGYGVQFLGFGGAFWEFWYRRCIFGWLFGHWHCMVF